MARSVLLYAATWTTLLMVMVGVASFTAEFAFVMAVSPPSYISKSCVGEGLIRIPMEVSGEITCFPAKLLKRSELDVYVPIVCLALVVLGSASMLRAMGFTHGDDDD